MNCTPKVGHQLNFWRCISMKHSLQTKLKVIKYILDGCGGKREAAKKFGVHYTCLHQWLARYRIHGLKGITQKAGSYSGEFKLSVVQFVLEHQMAYHAAAAQFNIPAVTTVKNWIKLYKEKGSSALFSERRGRSQTMKKITLPIDHTEPLNKLSSEEMAAELRYLRAENDYLKKYLALTQGKIFLVQKKK